MGRRHNGNEEQALQLILEGLGNGGVANYVKILDGVQAPSSPMKHIAEAFDRYHRPSRSTQDSPAQAAPQLFWHVLMLWHTLHSQGVLRKEKKGYAARRHI